MFTGLVQAIGQATIALGEINVQSPDFITAVKPKEGDSIAVDGVCLTATRVEPWGFQADVSPETRARSTMGYPTVSRSRTMVNLEPALRLQDRLGGHLVSGHVDGLGTILVIERQPRAWTVEIRWHDGNFGRYMADKGSVAVDGISLTVAQCSPGGTSFSAAVIPATWHRTTLQYGKVGDLVNLEADLLAKYSERLLGLDPPGSTTTQKKTISPLWLQEQGWI